MLISFLQTEEEEETYFQRPNACVMILTCTHIYTPERGHQKNADDEGREGNADNDLCT